MARVASGLDRLVHEGPEVAGLRRGARVGLVVHPASIDALARHTLDLLTLGPHVEVVRLFGPEHGVRGQAQDMESVAGSVDGATGTPVSSLYGDTPASLRPRADDLRGLDAVIYDLQDVGSRYYTFVYTLSYVMEAARDASIPVVVLDRPNPIGGLAVEGPVLEESLASFVGRYPLPARHGMTSGELALLFRREFGIGGDLRVVRMAGWRRPMHFEETGLPWVAPSPNMPTVDTALVYPGGCLVEGTNLSEGRGTTRPFEQVGAPWLQGLGLARAMTDSGLEGALFRAACFRPMFQKFAGAVCEGVQIHVTDRSAFRPFATYLALLRETRRQDPEAFAWRTEAYEFEAERMAIDLLLGRHGLRAMIEEGATVGEMEATWVEGLRDFLARRRSVLLYED